MLYLVIYMIYYHYLINNSITIIKIIKYNMHKNVYIFKMKKKIESIIIRIK